MVPAKRLIPLGVCVCPHLFKCCQGLSDRVDMRFSLLLFAASVLACTVPPSKQAPRTLAAKETGSTRAIDSLAGIRACRIDPTCAENSCAVLGRFGVGTDDLHNQCLQRFWNCAQEKTKQVRVLCYRGNDTWFKTRVKREIERMARAYQLRNQICDAWWERGSRIEEEVANLCVQAVTKGLWSNPELRKAESKRTREEAAAALGKKPEDVTNDELGQWVLQQQLADLDP